MGGKSSSSNKTSTTNQTVSGSVGIDGDNTGYVVSGVRDSQITVTDGGSVQAALEVMTKANDNVTSMAKDMTTQALVTAQEATTGAMDVMKNLSMQSDSGTVQEVSKYFMYGAVALSVAYAVRGKL